MQSASDVYTVANSSTRCVASMKADTGLDRFLLGTTNVNGKNEVLLVEYDNRRNTSFSEKIYDIGEQVWGIAPSPFDPSLCFVIYGSDEDNKQAKLVKLSNLQSSDYVEGKEDAYPTPEEAEKDVKAPAEEESGESGEEQGKVPEVGAAGEDKSPLIKESIPDEDSRAGEEKNVLAVLDTVPHGKVVSITWHPGSLENSSHPRECIILYDAAYGGYVVDDQNRLKNVFFFDVPAGCTAGMWDPLHTQLFAIARGRDLEVREIRSNDVVSRVPDAHHDAIVSLDYNPNRPGVLCSAARDGYVNIWHFEGAEAKMVKCIRAHSHWVTSVHFHPLHDQLLLSSSTDGTAALWSMYSVSSERMRDNPQPDRQVLTLNSNGSAFYSCCWSSKNPWLFGAACFAGKLYFGRVPSEEIRTILDQY